MEPTTAGRETSEFALTKWVFGAGAVLEVLALVLEALRPLLPTAQWLSIGLVAVGGLMQVAVALGYQRSRTAVKQTALAADAQRLVQVAPATPQPEILTRP